MEKVENKTSESFLNYPNSKVTVLLEAMKDLKKHVDEFDKVVTDYKKNLDLIEHLHEMIEEVPAFCCGVHTVMLSYKITLILCNNAVVAIFVIKPMHHSPFHAYLRQFLRVELLNQFLRVELLNQNVTIF